MSLTGPEVTPPPTPRHTPHPSRPSDREDSRHQSVRPICCVLALHRTADGVWYQSERSGENAKVELTAWSGKPIASGKPSAGLLAAAQAARQV